jgi:predicted O-methyltransferase YrrM
VEFGIDRSFPELSALIKVDEDVLRGYYSDLENDTSFLEAINDNIRDVPEFAGKNFKSAAELRAYRCLLYLITRVAQPEIFIETGVLNGLGSSFILLGLQHNKRGTLYSIDLPPVDLRILSQGTYPLPEGKEPGWIIPDHLRDRHRLLLGPAERLLPQTLTDLGRVDVFLHDSDHSYSHMMFEMGLAWRYLVEGGYLMADNVEQNPSFADFAKGVQAPSVVVSTFEGADRTWQHGLLMKP